MIRYILVGLIVFVLSIVVFAPADIVERMVDGQPGMAMSDPRGTLWHGQGSVNAKLSSGAQLNALLQWDFSLLSLLRLAPAYQWNLQNSHLQLSGSAGVSRRGQVASMQGWTDAVPLNLFLQAYDIVLAGNFEIAPTTLLVQNRLLSDIQGQIDWSGGKVQYILSGLSHEVELPPLAANLAQNEENQPTATVFTQGGSTPLIIATLGENGFAKVAMTKLFTRLLGNTWPGGDPDHAVVLVVEEQLL